MVLASLKRVLVGNPLSTAAAKHERLAKIPVLAIFASDLMSSVAYATEEILLVLVLGGWAPGEEQTIQYEGVADEPIGAELERVRELYFGVYPDGRERLAWAGLIHVRVRPIWLRYSDFAQSPETIVEFSAGDLAALR